MVITVLEPLSINNMAALQTARAVIASYESWTIDAILSYRAENCLQYILPTSLGIKPMNNAQYAAYFGLQIPLFRDFKLKVHDTFHDAATQKVSMWVTSNAMTDIGEYRNEYMIVLHLNEEGTKVEKLLEYVDSAHSIKFMGMLTAEVEKRRKEGGVL